jgi:hypothetical protein
MLAFGGKASVHRQLQSPSTEPKYELLWYQVGTISAAQASS